MTPFADALSGAAAMASLAVALFFLKYWRRTRDTFSCCLQRLLLSTPRRASRSE